MADEKLNVSKTIAEIAKRKLEELKADKNAISASSTGNENNQVTLNTTTKETPVVAPTANVEAATTTTQTPTTETSPVTQQNDAASTATVTTPTTTQPSETAPVASPTPDTGVSSAVASELYTSNPVLNDYATKQGYKVQQINGEIYINNSLVDWKKLGMTYKDGKLYGTQAQYDQLLKMIKDNGYTTGETFAEYALAQGYKITRSSDGKYILLNGIPVDPSLYDNMNQLNGNWVGTAAKYQEMIADALAPTKVDPDYVASKNLTDYLTRKRLKVTTTDGKVNINGYVLSTKYYPGLKLVNGVLTGDEATYRQVMIDSMIYSRQDLITWAAENGHKVGTLENGYITIDGKAVHEPYFRDMTGGLKAIEGKWYASEDIYQSIMDDVATRSDYSLDEYARVIGLKVGQDELGNITIDGKVVAGTNNKDPVGYGSATYYEGVKLVNGKYVGSEDTYRAVLQDLASRSDKTFTDYASSTGNTVGVINNKVYINGNLVDTSGTSIQVINGQAYGTEEDFNTLIEKSNAAYEYVSPYQDQIDAALAEIQAFEAYQTPQETLDQINQLMESAKEKFNYDPNADSALRTAQKEAERVVREAAGSKGMLYSSGTISTAAKRAGELIPTYEQAAYNRWADQKSREMNLMNTIMQWDEMQSQRNMDSLNLIKTKFDTIMDMDGKTLEKFKVMLDQKNADRQAALDQESLDLDKKAQAIDEAWKRTEQLGYVDQAASLVLGVPVGTKAAWAQQAALKQANALENLRVQNEYAKQNQASQAATEKSLIEYKAALDQASQERILAQQYANDKAIAQQTYANNLAIASGSYKSAGGTSTVVKYGMSGASVKALQTALKARGYNIAVDGNFGPATLAAVKSFQKANGLAVDGVAGPKTLAKLG